jgi:hypothetical protein
MLATHLNITCFSFPKLFSTSIVFFWVVDSSSITFHIPNSNILNWIDDYSSFDGDFHLFLTPKFKSNYKSSGSVISHVTTPRLIVFSQVMDNNIPL